MASSKPASISSLPAELLRNIFNILHERAVQEDADMSSFASLCCVSRDFYDHATPLLYSEIQLFNFKVRLPALISVRQENLEKIKTLELRDFTSYLEEGAWSGQDELKMGLLIAELVAKAKKLESLLLKNCAEPQLLSQDLNVEFWKNVVCAVSDSSTLTTLALYTCTVNLIESTSLPNVKHLSFADSTVYQLEPSSFPSVSNLSLDTRSMQWDEDEGSPVPLVWHTIQKGTLRYLKVEDSLTLSEQALAALLEKDHSGGGNLEELTVNFQLADMSIFRKAPKADIKPKGSSKSQDGDAVRNLKLSLGTTIYDEKDFPKLLETLPNLLAPASSGKKIKYIQLHVKLGYEAEDVDKHGLSVLDRIQKKWGEKTRKGLMQMAVQAEVTFDYY